MNQKLLGGILVLISAVCFGFIPIFARFAYEGSVSVNGLLFIRFFLAFILVGIFLRLTGRFYIPSRTQFLFLLALGGIVYFLAAFLYFTSFLFIPISVAVLIANTYPVFVITVSLALGLEKISLSLIFSVLLTLIGLAFLSNPILNVSTIGILLSLGTAVTYAAYTLLLPRALKGLSSEIGAFYLMGAAGFSFGMFGVLKNDLQFPWDIKTWAWIMMISVISTTVALIMLFKGIKIIGPSRTSVLSTVEPATAVVLASILFKDALNITQWIGGILILFATILIATKKS
ncbi:MAG: DMT family transporter [Candidatus Bathycorpusculaceae bacterium]